MANNILNKISFSVSAELSKEELEYNVRQSLEGIDTLYSYLIYAKYKNNTLKNWIIEYNFSQKDKYNTINSFDIVENIVDSLISSKNVVKSVISYKQPNVELMLELYKPLIKKLAREQSEKWNELEYEDAFVMCQLTMVTLYKKGYYIHKHLLKRSFENAVLMHLRKCRDKPEILSFEQIVTGGSDDESLTLGDMLPDVNCELEREKMEEREVFNIIFSEVKSMIIDLIGERQFEQLLRDYGNKNTTSWSRKKMQQIKEKFKLRGITWSYFNKR